jgi:D-sedoheptulose 7-phosphate isomerase
MEDITKYLISKGEAMERCLAEQNADLDLMGELGLLAQILLNAIRERRMVFFFGNGGSAAEATHIAGEFTSYCVKKHEPWAAISLNDSNSVLTAIPNDYNFEAVFERQISALAKPGDVAIGLSTSGRSRNVLNGLAVAKKIGCSTVLLTSVRAEAQKFPYCDLTLQAKSEVTTTIQEIHLHWLHAIIEHIELSI